MNGGGDVVFGKDAIQQGAVQHVALVTGDLAARDDLQPVQNVVMGVREIVDDHDLIASGDQLDIGVGSDEPGAAGQEDFLGHVETPLLPARKVRWNGAKISSESRVGENFGE